jgi:HK97 family phage major capsid protein
MPELSKARELREERKRVCVQAQAVLNNAALAAEDRNRQFDAFMADADRMMADIERHERIERLMEETRGTGAPPARQPAGGAADPATAEKDYRGAYRNYLKYGLYARPDFKIRGVSAGDRTILESRGRQQIQMTREEWERELRVVTGGAGITGGAMSQQGAYPGATSGFFVPVGFVDEIEQALKYYGPMLDGGPGMPTIMPTDTGQPLPFPTSNDTNVVGEQVGEQATVSQGVINMGNIVFGAFKFSTKLIQVSIELLQDSAFNIEDWLKARFAEPAGAHPEHQDDGGCGDHDAERDRDCVDAWAHVRGCWRQRRGERGEYDRVGRPGHAGARAGHRVSPRGEVHDARSDHRGAEENQGQVRAAVVAAGYHQRVSLPGQQRHGPVADGAEAVTEVHFMLSH